MPTGPCLLDTVTLSEVIKGRDPEVLRHAGEYLSLYGRFQLSIITRYEIQAHPRSHCRELATGVTVTPLRALLDRL